MKSVAPVYFFFFLIFRLDRGKHTHTGAVSIMHFYTRRHRRHLYKTHIHKEIVRLLAHNTMHYTKHK